MRIVLVQSRIPAPDRCGSDLRLMQIIDALLALGHDLTFVSTWVEESADSLEELRRRNVRVFHEDAEALRLVGVDRIPSWSFRTLLAKNCFDRAILCLWFWQQFSIPELYLGTIRRYSPATGVLLLSDDSHGARERMLATLSTGVIARATHLEFAEAVARREQESYSAADAILTVTEADRRAAESLAPHAVPVRTAPFHVSLPTGGRPGFAERSGLLFLGNFTNPAVDDACRWLVEQVLPEVCSRMPQMTLTIAGYHSDRYAGPIPPHVHVLGPVAELQPLFDRHLVFLSPIRAGTGICTKNLTAMAAGIPLITTAIGAQELPGHPPQSFRQADSPLALALEVISVCSDGSAWAALVRQARAAVESAASGASATALGSALSEALASAHARLATDASTVFSTRAIEERIPGLRTLLPANERKTERFRATFVLGQELIARGWVEDGILQLRHALTAVRFGADPGRGLGAVFDALARSYGLLADHEAVSRSRAAAGAIRAAHLRGEVPAIF